MGIHTEVESGEELPTKGKLGEPEHLPRTININPIPGRRENPRPHADKSAKQERQSHAQGGELIYVASEKKLIFQLDAK